MHPVFVTRSAPSVPIWFVTPATYGNCPGTNRVAKPKRPPRDEFDVPSYRRAIYRGCELAFGMPGDLDAVPSAKIGKDLTFGFFELFLDERDLLLEADSQRPGLGMFLQLLELLL